MKGKNWKEPGAGKGSRSATGMASIDAPKGTEVVNLNLAEVQKMVDSNLGMVLVANADQDDSIGFLGCDSIDISARPTLELVYEP